MSWFWRTARVRWRITAFISHLDFSSIFLDVCDVIRQRFVRVAPRWRIFINCDLLIYHEFSRRSYPVRRIFLTGECQLVVELWYRVHQDISSVPDLVLGDLKLIQM